MTTINPNSTFADMMLRIAGLDGNTGNTGTGTNPIVAEMPEGAAENTKTYMERILETEMEYKPEIIEAVKEFKKYHKIGAEDDVARLNAMAALAHAVAVAEHKPTPIVQMEHIDGSPSYRSDYNEITHTITMRGKLSIVTFLHELAHAVYAYDEHMARVWSIKLFKKVYPKAFANLKVVDGFALVRPDDTIARPIAERG